MCPLYSQLKQSVLLDIDSSTRPFLSLPEWESQGIKRYDYRLFDWVSAHNEAVRAEYGDNAEETKKRLNNAAARKANLERNQAVHAEHGDNTEEAKKHLNNAKAVEAARKAHVEKKQAVVAKYGVNIPEETKKRLSNAKGIEAARKANLERNQAVVAKYGDNTEEAKKHLNNAKGAEAARKANLEQNQAVVAKHGDNTEEAKKHLNNAKGVAASIEARKVNFYPQSKKAFDENMAKRNELLKSLTKSEKQDARKVNGKAKQGFKMEEPHHLFFCKEGHLSRRPLYILQHDKRIIAWGNTCAERINGKQCACRTFPFLEKEDMGKLNPNSFVNMREHQKTMKRKEKKNEKDRNKK